MQESLDVSFVIPSFASRDTIGRTLESVFAQDTGLRFEVIVVESSQGSTVEWVTTHFPEVTLISAKTRLAPGAARNRGAESAGGKYLAFLDADACLAPAWLRTVHQCLESSATVKVVGSGIDIDNPGSAFSQVLHWIEFSEFLPGSPTGFRPHLSSCNLLVSREDFLAAGGFDEGYFMAEDLLLSRAFQGSLYYEGTTKVDHIFRSGWKQVSTHLKKLGYWSGRLRREFEVSGSWLKSVPTLGLLLPPIRAVLIVARVGRVNPRAGIKAVAYSPLIVAALFKWSSGLYLGLRNSPEPGDQ